MGRIEKKFQKRKERERAVRKKILKKREAAHVAAKELEKQDALEREVAKAENKPIRKNKPIRNMSPALKEALEKVQAMTEEAFKDEKDPDVDKSDETLVGPTTTVQVKSDTTDVATAWAPKYTAEATLELLGK